MTIHSLKIDITPFNDLLSGAKTGEVRNDDRGFEVGDMVHLNCSDGRTAERTISHIQRGYGLPEGICVLSYTRAVPDVPELVRYSRDRIMLSIDFSDEPRPNINGEYVRYDQAAEIIAAEQQKTKDAEELAFRMDRFATKYLRHNRNAEQRAEAAEDELAQIKAQKPVAAVEIRALNGRKVKHIYPINLDNVGAGSALYAAPVSGSLKADRIERELDGYIQHFSEQKRIAPVHVTKALSELKRRLLSTLNVETSNDKG